MPEAALLETQQQSGGVLPEQDADVSPAVLHFGDPRAEYHAARNEAALFDLSDRTQIEITGNDRALFLNNFCTNEVMALQPHQGCEAFITNVKGRVLGHVFVFVAPESIWLESVPNAEETLLPHLDRYLIREDAQLHGRTGEVGELFVSGPQAADVLAKLQIDAADLEPYHHTGIETLDHPLFVRRVDLLGTPGYLLSVPRDRLADLWNRLTDDAGLTPAGREAFEALRIEAVMPRHGVDITEDRLASEVGRDKQAISYTKGCYLGQEPIARIDALGHVNRLLFGLRLESGPVPQPEASVTAGEDDKPIGSVTSAALSYADDRPVALAYLRTKAAQPGGTVTVQTEGGPIPAEVFAGP